MFCSIKITIPRELKVWISKRASPAGVAGKYRGFKTNTIVLCKRRLSMLTLTVGKLAGWNIIRYPYSKAKKRIKDQMIKNRNISIAKRLFTLSMAWIATYILSTAPITLNKRIIASPVLVVAHERNKIPSRINNPPTAKNRWKNSKCCSFDLDIYIISQIEI